MIRGISALLVAGVVGTGLVAATPAHAQEAAPPFDPAIDVQLFEYAIGPKTFFTVDDGVVSGPKQLTFDFLLTFLTNPFTVYNVDEQDDVIEGTRTNVVESMLAGELSAAYGLSDRFQLGLAMPVILQMSGEGLMPSTGGGAPGGLKVSGTGDLRAELKTRLWHGGSLTLAGAAGLTLPTSFGSGEGQFIGDDLPSGRARLIAQWTGAGGKLSLGANVGVRLRKPRTIYASTVGQQLGWGVAAAYRVTDRFSLVGESFGRTGLEGLDLDASPLEADGGMRVLATKALAVVVGGGAGLVKGIGSPDLRVFVSVGYAPDTRDTDGDGVPNNRDRCVVAPEDHDGFEDSDGCPDDDNDGDRRDDANDKCPNEPEDFDGFDDDDGCPEKDNDNDGIDDLDDKCMNDPEDKREPFPNDGCPYDKRDTDGDRVMDHLDACPTDAEDLDGFEDWDGCPDLDQDKDGIADEDDQCPLCAEDKDGFNDDDGCPDLDNDGDGFLDVGDTCPMEAETINGIDDLDGCPDEGGVLLVQLDGDKLTLLRQPTFDKGGLNKGGQIIVDQVALTMLQHPEITRWLIAVAAKSKADADKQARWVSERLEQRGVAKSRFEALTSAGTPQIGMIVKERVDEVPAAACPAGSEVVPRPAPAKPTPVTSTAPAAPPPAPVAAARPAPVPPAPHAAGGASLPPVFEKLQGPTTKIGFEAGGTLTGASVKTLDLLSALLKSNPDVILTIVVAGDGAQARADLARSHLVGKGVVPGQVEAVGSASAELGQTVELRFRTR